MIDLEKLNRMLDEALAAETPESLNAWLDEQEKADREAAAMLECGATVLDEVSRASMTEAQESVVESGMSEVVVYEQACALSDEFDTDSANPYNLAA
jgi:hypothetical protein